GQAVGGRRSWDNEPSPHDSVVPRCPSPLASGMRPLSPPTDIAALNPRRGGAVLATVLVACLLVLSAQARSRSGRGTVLQEWILTAAAPLPNGAASVSR